MKRILLFIIAALSIVSCKSTKTFLPGVSGKAGEVVIVITKENWDGALGEETRELLGSDVPYLAQREPLYSLVNLAPTGFTDMFQIHRNIVYFNVNPQVDSAAVIFRNDVWASPQCVIQINAQNSDAAIELLQKKGTNIARYIEQAERDRVIRNTMQYEEKQLADVLPERFGGKMHFPMGYKLRKATDDFVWIANDKQYVYQDVLIYKYPAEEDHPFTSSNIIKHRNEIMKANVPGMRENSYMITSPHFTPMVEYLKYKGRNLVQTRGMWDVENDYMGGPFVSHSFYSQDGKEIIVLEAFVYAPRFDKRQYLRQVESLLYSWEWTNDEEIEQK